MISSDIASSDASSNSAYVYVISAGAEAVKVGLTGNPHQRIRELQTAHYHPLNLFSAINCGSDASATEHMAHALLRSKRMAGEWFAVSPEHAREVVERALSAVRRGELPPVDATTVKSIKQKRPPVLEELLPQSNDIPSESDIALLGVLLALGQCHGVDSDLPISEVNSRLGDVRNGRPMSDFDVFGEAMSRIMRFWLNYSTIPGAYKYMQYGLYPQTKVFSSATLSWEEGVVGCSLSLASEGLMREHGVYIFFQFAATKIREARLSQDALKEQAA